MRFDKSSSAAHASLGLSILILVGVMGLATAASAQNESIDNQSIDNQSINSQSINSQPINSQPIDLPRVEVKAEVPSDSLSLSGIAQARAELAGIPGGVSLVDEAGMRQGVTGDMAEVLANVPGLFVRSRFGGDEVRLSIRGSGITQTFGIRGVRILRDGMPESGAGGFTNPELVDFASARFVEVYRGANALQFGGADLGGAINFVSHTGYSTQRLRARLEAGSNSYFRPQVSGGGTFGAAGDGFFSVSGIRQDGFRDHSDQNTIRSYGNIGHRWNEGSESRLHLTAQRNNLKLPGPLRLSQLLDDPEQANGFWRANAAKRDFERYQLALQHGFDWETSRLKFGGWFGHTELDHPLPFVVIDDETNHFGAHLRHEIDGSLGGRDHRFVWGVQAAFEDSDGQQFAPAGGGRRGALRQDNSAEASSVELFAESRWRLTDSLSLVNGAQAAFARREAVIDFTNPATSDIDDSKNYSGFSPKIGLVWQARDRIQLFSNLSASFEPPSLQDFRNENDPSPDARANLKAQQAITAEVGSRGRAGELVWEAALYYAWIDNEILQQETAPGSGQGFVTNVDETRHSGLELGLSGEHDLPGADGRHTLTWNLSYAHNRFRFDRDAQFGNNHLPGLPRNLGRLEIAYRHASGFYIGPIFEAADGARIDFANTLEAPGYGIWGLRAGYERGDGLKLFAEGRNLANKAYVSNTGITANANGNDGTFFNPGLTRAFFGGIEVLFH